MEMLLRPGPEEKNKKKEEQSNQLKKDPNIKENLEVVNEAIKRFWLGSFYPEIIEKVRTISNTQKQNQTKYYTPEEKEIKESEKESEKIIVTIKKHKEYTLNEEQNPNLNFNDLELYFYPFSIEERRTRTTFNKQEKNQTRDTGYDEIIMMATMYHNSIFYLTSEERDKLLGLELKEIKSRYPQLYESAKKNLNGAKVYCQASFDSRTPEEGSEENRDSIDIRETYEGNKSIVKGYEKDIREKIGGLFQVYPSFSLLLTDPNSSQEVKSFLAEVDLIIEIFNGYLNNTITPAAKEKIDKWFDENGIQTEERKKIIDDDIKKLESIKEKLESNDKEKRKEGFRELNKFKFEYQNARNKYDSLKDTEKKDLVFFSYFLDWTYRGAVIAPQPETKLMDAQIGYENGTTEFNPSTGEWKTQAKAYVELTNINIPININIVEESVKKAFETANPDAKIEIDKQNSIIQRNEKGYTRIKFIIKIEKSGIIPENLKDRDTEELTKIYLPRTVNPEYNYKNQNDKVLVYRAELNVNENEEQNETHITKNLGEGGGAGFSLKVGSNVNFTSLGDKVAYEAGQREFTARLIVFIESLLGNKITKEEAFVLGVFGDFGYPYWGYLYKTPDFNTAVTEIKNHIKSEAEKYYDKESEEYKKICEIVDNASITEETVQGEKTRRIKIDPKFGSKSVFLDLLKLNMEKRRLIVEAEIINNDSNLDESTKANKIGNIKGKILNLYREFIRENKDFFSDQKLLIAQKGIEEIVNSIAKSNYIEIELGQKEKLGVLKIIIGLTYGFGAGINYGDPKNLPTQVNANNFFPLSITVQNYGLSLGGILSFEKEFKIGKNWTFNFLQNFGIASLKPKYVDLLNRNDGGDGQKLYESVYGDNGLGKNTQALASLISNAKDANEIERYINSNIGIIKRQVDNLLKIGIIAKNKQLQKRIEQFNAYVDKLEKDQQFFLQEKSTRFNKFFNLINDIESFIKTYYVFDREDIYSTTAVNIGNYGNYGISFPLTIPEDSEIFLFYSKTKLEASTLLLKEFGIDAPLLTTVGLEIYTIPLEIIRKKAEKALSNRDLEPESPIDITPQDMYKVISEELQFNNKLMFLLNPYFEISYPLSIKYGNNNEIKIIPKGSGEIGTKIYKFDINILLSSTTNNQTIELGLGGGIRTQKIEDEYLGFIQSGAWFGLKNIFVDGSEFTISAGSNYPIFRSGNMFNSWWVNLSTKIHIYQTGKNRQDTQAQTTQDNNIISNELESINQKKAILYNFYSSLPDKHKIRIAGNSGFKNKEELETFLSDKTTIEKLEHNKEKIKKVVDAINDLEKDLQSTLFIEYIKENEEKNGGSLPFKIEIEDNQLFRNQTIKLNGNYVPSQEALRLIIKEKIVEYNKTVSKELQISEEKINKAEPKELFDIYLLIALPDEWVKQDEELKLIGSK
jgi:hypothetical protein